MEAEEGVVEWWGQKRAKYEEGEKMEIVRSVGMWSIQPNPHHPEQLLFSAFIQHGYRSGVMNI